MAKWIKRSDSLVGIYRQAIRASVRSGLHALAIYFASMVTLWFLLDSLSHWIPAPKRNGIDAVLTDYTCGLTYLFVSVVLLLVCIASAFLLAFVLNNFSHYFSSRGAILISLVIGALVVFGLNICLGGGTVISLRDAHYWLLLGLPSVLCILACGSMGIEIKNWLIADTSIVQARSIRLILSIFIVLLSSILLAVLLLMFAPEYSTPPI